MGKPAKIFLLALCLGWSILAASASAAEEGEGEVAGGVWDTSELGVKVLLKHAQNVTAPQNENDKPKDSSCLVFLLYSTSCPFSREAYADVENLSRQYNDTVAFVALEKSLSSLTFLMQFGFHAVPQLLIYSPKGREKLRWRDSHGALHDYLRKLTSNPNISCNIATFSDVFPEVVREPKPVEWSDGSRELANYCWVIVGVLLVYYLSTSKYVRGYGWAREDDARSKDE